MTRNEFKQILKNIKNECKKHENCDSCPFAEEGKCQVQLLKGKPSSWDDKIIEEI